MGWAMQARIRHVTSGRYLAGTAEGSVVTVHRQKADEDTTAFNLMLSKVNILWCCLVLTNYTT